MDVCLTFTRCSPRSMAVGSARCTNNQSSSFVINHGVDAGFLNPGWMAFWQGPTPRFCSTLPYAPYSSRTTTGTSHRLLCRSSQARYEKRWELGGFFRAGPSFASGQGLSLAENYAQHPCQTVPPDCRRDGNCSCQSICCSWPGRLIDERPAASGPLPPGPKRPLRHHRHSNHC
jgi:hypothetical protein